ncbi:Uncharacterised protein (plasmid) [Legionella adelaidensis]|uniref:Uncharacterized protein n=2 Tax=Legionella adelaidensis TaxID=45056 RepID=A0A0W0R1B1_9GAMM|nr:hypothetical protein Lade_2039 [Legionella adelaidensis]VEH81292.1 Uncharacterised protein [Legionella adelaidensis]
MLPLYKKLTFQVEPCKNKTQKLEKVDAYKVALLTESSEPDLFWGTKLKFFPKPHSIDEATSVVDIYSLNYEVSMQENSSLVDKRKVKKINRDLSSLTCMPPSSAKHIHAQVVLVLDIKTKEEGYNNKGIIQTKEQEFLSLFNQTPSISFIDTLQKAGLQYVILEGSLKADLLGKNLFEETHEKHLQSTSEDFCQLVEFMINAFKRGETVVIKNKSHGVEYTFNAADYLKKISPDMPDYQPANMSVTVYPKQYYSIATQGTYTKAMQASGLFKLSTVANDETGIVQMTTEKIIHQKMVGC